MPASKREDCELWILLTLADSAPMSLHHIWQIIGKPNKSKQKTVKITKPTTPKFSEPIIRKFANDLEHNGLIKSKRVKGNKHIQGPQWRNHYELTRTGLMQLIVLAAIGESKVLYVPDRFAEKYHDLLPEIFDLWPNFVQARVQHLARVRLERYCKKAIQEEVRIQMFGQTDRSRARLRRYLDDFFLARYPDGEPWEQGQVPPYRERWRQALLGDKGLRDAATESCRNRIAELSKETDWFTKFFETEGNESESKALSEATRILNSTFNQG